MRLQHLVLENFGVHASRRIEFGPGLQVVFGPNESGKTTLLAALRQTLFGIPLESNYGGDATGTRTKARVELANGTHITVTRKRARSDSGLGGEIEETREPLTKELWERALGGASQSLFENLFAFSLGELASGERSLLEAGLTEALYGMAVGGLKRFRQLATDLDTRAEELFTKRGRAKRANVLLNEFLAVRKAYEQSRFTGTDYTNLEEEITEHEQGASRNRDQENEARRSLRELERIEAALPAWREAEALQAQLAQIGAGATLAAGVAESLRALIAKERELASDLTRQRDRVTTKAEEGELPGGRFVAWAVPIRELADQVGQVREALAGRDQLELEMRRLDQRIAAAIAEIHTDWSTADLPRVTASLACGEVARELEALATQLEQTLTGLQARRTELEEQHDRLESRLHSLPATDRLPGVRELVGRAEEYKLEARRLAEAGPAREALERQTTQSQRQLASQLALTAEALDGLAIPLTATIDRYVTEWDTATREQATAAQSLKAIEKRFRAAGNELAAFDRDNPGGDRDELLSLRAEREDGWQLVLALIEMRIKSNDPALVKWTNGHPDQLIEQYRDRVVRADLASDRLLANAERTARRQQLVISLEQLESQVTEAREGLSMTEQAVAQLSGQWTAEWSLGTPRPPREMSEWIKEHARWCDLRERWVAATNDAERDRAVLQALEEELLRAFPNDQAEAPLKQGISPRIREALSQLQVHEQVLTKAAQERDRWQGELRELKIQRDSLEREQFEVALKQGALDARRGELLSMLGLPRDWSIGVVSRVVTHGKETQSLTREREAVTLRMERINQTLDAFRMAATPLAGDLGELTDEIPRLCERVLTWRGELDDRQRLELEQKTLLAERSTAEQMTHRLREQSEATVREIESLRRQAGLEEGADLLTFLREASQAEALRAKLREVTPRWQAHSDSDPAFADKLRAASLDALTQERERLAEVIREHDSARSRELAQAETLRTRLKARSEETKALDLAQKLEFVRSQLVDVVDQWAPLTLARHLMEAALQRFEKTQQPQLLLEAGKLFEQLTLGEYVQLTRAVGETNTLHAIPRQGAQKTPAELSTGTREQLYLAIRLAYLKQYAAKAEPLPLVMDDVLVNFDEDRAKQTLSVLRDFAKDHQILFLTCHRHVVDLARQVDGDLQPIELRTGTLARAEPLVPFVEGSPEPRRSPRPKLRKPDEPVRPLLFRDPLEG